MPKHLEVIFSHHRMNRQLGITERKLLSEKFTKSQKKFILKSTPMPLSLRRKYFQKIIEPLQGSKILFRRTDSSHNSRIYEGFELRNSTIITFLTASRRIGKCYGSEVMTYFSLLRSLMGLNLLIFISALSLLIVLSSLLKQSFIDNHYYNSSIEVRRCSQKYESSIAEMDDTYNQSQITKMFFISIVSGWAKNSPMFYGHYREEIKTPVAYSLTAAYFFFVIFSFGLSMLFVIRWSVRCIRIMIVKNKMLDYERSSFLIFTAWDFSLHNAAAVAKKSVIYTTLLLELERSNFLNNLSLKQRYLLHKRRIPVFILNAIILTSFLVVIYYSQIYSSNYSNENKLTTSIFRVFIEYLPQLVIILSGSLFYHVNKICIQKLENYRVDLAHLTLLFRIFLSRVFSIVVWMYAIFRSVYCSSGEQCYSENNNCGKFMCWETYVGQQIVKLIILQFFTTLASFLIKDLMRYFISKNLNIRLTILGSPNFDAQNETANIIYVQFIAWLGVLFCPALPGLVCGFYTITYGIKRFCCRYTYLPINPQILLTPTIHIKMMVIFVIISFTSVSLCLTMLVPSKGCGPFRSYNRMVNLFVRKELTEFPYWCVSVIKCLSSSSFYVTLIMAVLLLIRYLQSVASVYEAINITLSKRLDLARKIASFRALHPFGISSEKVFVIYHPKGIPGKKVSKRRWSQRLRIGHKFRNSIMPISSTASSDKPFQLLKRFYGKDEIPPKLLEEIVKEPDRTRKLLMLRRLAIPLRVKVSLKEMVIDQSEFTVDIISPNSVLALVRRKLECFYRLSISSHIYNIIEANFGSGVSAYFKLLRDCFWLNLIIFTAALSSVIIPQAITIYSDTKTSAMAQLGEFSIVYNCTMAYERHINSSKVELSRFIINRLTGGLAWLSFDQYLFMYFGEYFPFQDSGYDMTLAYSCFILSTFLFTFIYIFHREGYTFKQWIHDKKDRQLEFYSNLVLTTWDYSFQKSKRKGLQQLWFTNRLNMDISKDKHNDRLSRMTLKEKCILYVKRVVINLFIVFTLFAAAYVIHKTQIRSTSYVMKYHKDKSAMTLFIEFIPTICVTLFCIVLPIIYQFVIQFEDYNGEVVLIITLIRSGFLRLFTLTVLISALYGLSTCTSKDACNVGIGECQKIYCWETFIGQQFYKLMFNTFLEIVLSGFLIEIPLSVISNFLKTKKLGKLIPPPELNISHNVLQLLTLQLVVLLGTLFCPYLPGFGCLVIFILWLKTYIFLFWIYKLPTIPYKAVRSQILYFICMVIIFFSSILLIGYCCSEIPTSKSCGPFRKQDYIFSRQRSVIGQYPDAIQTIYHLFIDGLFIWIMTLLLLLVLAYYFRTVYVIRRSLNVYLEKYLFHSKRNTELAFERIHTRFHGISSE